MKVYYGKDIDKRVMRNIVGKVKGNLRFGEGCVKGDDGENIDEENNHTGDRDRPWKIPHWVLWNNSC